jgi:hypothetical protein
METRQALVHQSIRNSVIVLDHPEFDRPEIAGLRAQLRKHARELEELAQSQLNNHSARRVDGRQVAMLRKDLRARLLRISSHAAVTLRGLPGIEEDLRVPHASRKTADLVEAAARICGNLKPHLRTLYRTGLRKDAIREVERLARQLEAKHADPDTAIARRSRATASIPDALRDARDVVRALDRAIRLEFAGNHAALHRWSRAKRIPRKLGRPRKKDDQPLRPPDATA